MGLGSHYFKFYSSSKAILTFITKFHIRISVLTKWECSQASQVLKSGTSGRAACLCIKIHPHPIPNPRENAAPEKMDSAFPFLGPCGPVRALARALLQNVNDLAFSTLSQTGCMWQFALQECPTTRCKESGVLTHCRKKSHHWPGNTHLGLWH